MLTIATNDGNDLYLDSAGNIALAADLTAMADIYKHKSLVRKGELYYNTDEGIDFLNNIFEGIPDTAIFQKEVISQLENTDDTIDVTDYTYNITTENNRQVYNYTVTIESRYGTVYLNG